MTAPRAIVVWGVLPVVALSYAAMRQGGEDPVGVNAALLLLAAGGVVWGLTSGKGEPVTAWERRAILAALLFPAYVAFQLIPLPVAALRFVNPARAAVVDSLSAVTEPMTFAPVTILPGMTWAHLARVAGYALMFLLVYAAARRSERAVWRFTVALVVLGAFEAALGLSQHSAGAMLVLGTYANQNHYSALLEMTLPFALVLTVALAARVQLRGTFLPATLASMAGAAAAAAAMIGAIALSLSRAGFVAMLASFGVMAAVWLYPVASPRTRRAIVPLFVLVCVLAFFLAAPPELIENFAELSKDPYESDRWQISLDTMRMFADFPLLGTGLGTYYPGFLAYQSASVGLTWMYAHNDYLQLLAELGVAGFLTVAALVVIILRCAGRAALWPFDFEARLLGVGCIGSLTAILIHSVADFNLYIPANALAMACVAGMAVSLERRRMREPRSTIWPPVRRLVPAVAVWLVIFAGGWLVVLNAAELDPATETRLCTVGLCNPFNATNALKARHGGDLSLASPEELARILLRDPAGAYNWLNLGDALERLKMIDKARESFTRALELGPNIPFFQMRVAHFYFRQGEHRQGLQLMAKSIEGNPVFRDAAFDTYANHDIPLDDVLRFGIGGRDAAQAYFRKLLAVENTSAAAGTWAAMVGKGWADDKLTADYVNTLVAWEDYEDARRVWFTHAGQGSNVNPVNYVFNGDFEFDPTDSRFDWTLRAQAGVTPSLDPTQAFSGRRAARLDFHGTDNVHRIDLSQAVYLPPAHYQLDAVMKVADVTTREGVLLEIAGQGVQAATEPLTGTSEWVRVRAEFEVPANAGLLHLRAVRKRSFRYDNRIRGTAWIDQVQISRVDRAGSS